MTVHPFPSGPVRTSLDAFREGLINLQTHPNPNDPLGKTSLKSEMSLLHLPKRQQLFEIARQHGFLPLGYEIGAGTEFGMLAVRLHVRPDPNAFLPQELRHDEQ